MKGLHEINIVKAMLFTCHALTAQHLLCSQRSITKVLITITFFKSKTKTESRGH